LNDHLKKKALVTLAVRNRETQRYFKFDQNNQLVGWINKKTGESKISRPENFENAIEMAYSGIHIVQPEIFSLMPETDRFSITTFYLELAKTYSIKGYFDDSDLWMDVGKPEQLEEARRLYS
jgi:NDP-sugar pyrophosphorylase family protein